MPSLISIPQSSVGPSARTGAAFIELTTVGKEKTQKVWTIAGFELVDYVTSALGSTAIVIIDTVTKSMAMRSAVLVRFTITVANEATLSTELIRSK